jgi:hypothetical protein
MPPHIAATSPRKLRRALVVGCLVALPATALGAAKVKGKIDNFRLLENPVWSESKDAKKHGFSFREPVPTVRAEFRALFPHIPKEVCVAALAPAKQKPPPPILIRVGGGRTTPVTIVVPPGTQLTFQNTDPFKHRLYGVNIKTFPANDTIKGGTRDWSVPGPGVFEVRDELAPSLRMWIVGEPNVAAIAYPSLKGEFALSLELPGDYTVQPFFAGKKVGEPTVVTFNGNDLDLTRKPIKVAADAKPKKKDDEK